MKTLFSKLLLLVCSIALLTACGSESTTDDSSNNAFIEGTWALLSYSGGVTGVQDKAPEKPQYIQISDQNIKFFENGELQKEYLYSLEKGESIYSEGKEWLIKFVDNEQAINYSFDINGDTLLLYDEVYDGFIRKYIKQN